MDFLRLLSDLLSPGPKQTNQFNVTVNGAGQAGEAGLTTLLCLMIAGPLGYLGARMICHFSERPVPMNTGNAASASSASLPPMERFDLSFYTPRRVIKTRNFKDPRPPFKGFRAYLIQAVEMREGREGIVERWQKHMDIRDEGWFRELKGIDAAG